LLTYIPTLGIQTDGVVSNHNAKDLARRQTSTYWDGYKGRSREGVVL